MNINSQKDKSKQSTKMKKGLKSLVGVVYNIIDPELCKYALYMYIKPPYTFFYRRFLLNSMFTLLILHFDTFLVKKYIKNNKNI